MNMNIEEMKAAVLEECKRLCPNEEDTSMISKGVRLRRCWEPMGSLWSIDGELFSEWRPFKVVASYTQQDVENLQIAYRLLGLEAKAKDAEIQRLRDALKEIQKPAMIIGFGKKATVTQRAEQLTEDHKRVRLIAAKALKGDNQ